MAKTRASLIRIQAHSTKVALLSANGVVGTQTDPGKDGKTINSLFGFCVSMINLLTFAKSLSLYLAKVRI